MGELGWPPHVVGSTSIGVALATVAAYKAKERRESRERWEQTRLLATFIAAPHAKKGREIRNPQDLFQFDWEIRKTGGGSQLTQAEGLYLFQNWEQRDEIIKEIIEAKKGN